jgi:hypothetical protein
MKRLSLVLLIVFLAANFSFAQKGFRFGMKVAPMFSWMKPDFSIGETSDFSVQGGGGRLGVAWGPMAEIQLNETFLLSTGIDINYTSFRLEGKMKDSIGGESIVDWDQKYKTRFIEVPFKLKFRTKEIGYFRYFGLFGLGAGFLYSSSTEFSRTYSSSNPYTSTVSNDEYGKYIKRFRGSLLVGAGLEYSLSGNTALVGSLIFNNGLFNALQKQGNESDPKDPYYKVTAKAITNYMQLNIGILF